MINLTCNLESLGRLDPPQVMPGQQAPVNEPAVRTKKVIKHMLLQYSNQAANNARLILFLQNQQLRHRAAYDVSKFDKIVDLVNETADNNPPCPGEDGRQ